MAIRYSGDTEVRLGYDRKHRVYRGSVRDPYKKWNGEVSSFSFDPYTSSNYDHAAIKLIAKAQSQLGKFEIEKEKGRIKIRRVFQSPCPVKMVE
jgi:hypothetical protein